MLHSIGIKD